MELDTAVGRRVEALRLEAGFSQEELSERLRKAGLNWSQGTLSRVETGSRPVRFVEALTLAAALGVEVLDLSPAGSGISVAYQRRLQVLEEAKWKLTGATHAEAQADATARLLRLSLELSQGSQKRYQLHIAPHRFLSHLAYELGPGLPLPDLFRLLGTDPEVVNSGLAQVEADIAAGLDVPPAYAPPEFEAEIDFGGSEPGTDEHAEMISEARYLLEAGMVDRVFAETFPNVSCDAEPRQAKSLFQWPRPVVDGIDTTDFDQPLKKPTSIRAVHRGG